MHVRDLDHRELAGDSARSHDELCDRGVGAHEADRCPPFAVSGQPVDFEAFAHEQPGGLDVETRERHQRRRLLPFRGEVAETRRHEGGRGAILLLEPLDVVGSAGRRHHGGLDAPRAQEFGIALPVFVLARRRDPGKEHQLARGGFLHEAEAQQDDHEEQARLDESYGPEPTREAAFRRAAHSLFPKWRNLS